MHVTESLSFFMSGVLGGAGGPVLGSVCDDRAAVLGACVLLLPGTPGRLCGSLKDEVISSQR